MASVLLVDDTPELRKTIERLLVNAGHQVTTAPNGAAALRALESGTFDVIVTDIVMPDMEGLELIRTVRKTHASLPIIAMSGGGRGSVDNYLTLASSFGAAKTLEKPFPIETLKHAIDEVLRA
jgi:DNA-binding response OmpR family regulator